MADTTTLLQWHYILFLLPLGMALFMLLLSSLHFGHHHAGHGGHGHLGAHGHAAVHGHAAPHSGHAAHGAAAHGHSAHSAYAPGHARAAGGTKGGNGKDSTNSVRDPVVSPAGVLLGLIGVGRAPLPMVLEAFCIGWGLCGFWANELLVRTPNPSLLQMLPSVGIALAGGLIGARLASELIARLLPQEESLVVSHEALFGMIGSITFPASADAGRIHIYDEFGTLHDETCRVAAGHPPIEKGHRALVVDMDMQGRLIVEEVPDTVK